MKIIEVMDLIRMVYNGDKELPKVLIYGGESYRLFKDSFKTDYITNGGKMLFAEILSERYMNDFLSTELIIEEDKEIEKIGILYTGINSEIYENFAMKINELIDVVNKLNKGE